MAEQTPYQMMGGEKAVQGLVDRFYFFIDTLPEAKAVRAAHGPSLMAAKVKLFKYLSGWLGGPDLYVAEYGHPRLRQRHLPFKVGRQERDEWMLCMTKALQEMPMDEGLRVDLLNALDPLATHMINQVELAKERP